MSEIDQPSNGNLLLAAISHEEYERLEPHLQPVTLNLSEILYRPGESVRDVYFPRTAIISLLTELEDGGGMEVGLVGREGMAGIAAILGGEETKLATVQGAGSALKLKAETLHAEFNQGGTLQASLLRYTHALMTQISQSVVCNVRHPIAGRLARWLLMFSDRAGSDEFILTHEFMANMLGVRRSGVSEIANKLQKLGLISYRRGRIKILDRKGLEKFACECYPVVKQKYREFLL